VWWDTGIAPQLGGWHGLESTHLYAHVRACMDACMRADAHLRTPAQAAGKTYNVVRQKHGRHVM